MTKMADTFSAHKTQPSIQSCRNARLTSTSVMTNRARAASPITAICGVTDDVMMSMTFGLLCGLKSDVSPARHAHREHRTFARLARHGNIAAHHARELAGQGCCGPWPPGTTLLPPAKDCSSPRRGRGRTQRIKTRLLFIAQRIVKFRERGLHGLHCAKGSVEPLLHRPNPPVGVSIW